MSRVTTTLYCIFEWVNILISFSYFFFWAGLSSLLIPFFQKNCKYDFVKPHFFCDKRNNDNNINAKYEHIHFHQSFLFTHLPEWAFCSILCAGSQTQIILDHCSHSFLWTVHLKKFSCEYLFTMGASWTFPEPIIFFRSLYWANNRLMRTWLVK